MILKISRADDINSLITGKLAIKYAGRDIESMKAIANASSKRSLAEFQKVNNLQGIRRKLRLDIKYSSFCRNRT